MGKKKNPTNYGEILSPTPNTKYQKKLGLQVNGIKIPLTLFTDLIIPYFKQIWKSFSVQNSATLWGD